MKSLQTLGWDSNNRLFVVLMTQDEFQKEFPVAADGPLNRKLESVKLQNELLQFDKSEVHLDEKNTLLNRGFWIVDGAHRLVARLVRPRARRPMRCRPMRCARAHK